MKKNIISVLISLFILFFSCIACQSQGTTANSLPAKDFFEKIKVNINAPIVDVRTPDEFSKGHLARAVNINFNDPSFQTQVATLNKNKLVLVYCLSGGRSAKAAAQMRKDGFKDVVEMEGGMMKWRAAGLPETEAATSSGGMSMKEYEALHNTNKAVLIDFYADWCGPCLKMAPDLETIKNTMSSKVSVIRINVDENTNLTKALGIDALPTLVYFKNKQKVWQNTGYLSKAEILKKL